MINAGKRSSGLQVVHDPGTWRSWLDETGSEDLRLRPEFVRLALHLDSGQACCACWRNSGGTVIYPFIRREITSLPGRWDLTTPYDFGGPLIASRGVNDAAIMVAWLEEWRGWCLEEGVVSEFIRLDPLRFPSRVAEQLGPPFEEHQAHTVVDLAGGIAAVRSRYSASCRRNIRRGLAAGLSVAPGDSEDADSFVRLYCETMIRVAAPRYYLFPQAYFSGLLELPGMVLLATRSEAGMVAGGIFLQAGTDLYYFLGASDPEAWPLRANNVLFDGVIRWAVERGFERVHLGGGSRSLTRFKKSFSAATVPYFVVREIHDPETYKRLSLEVGAESSHFPAHRADEYLPLLPDMPQGGVATTKTGAGSR